MFVLFFFLLVPTCRKQYRLKIAKVVLYLAITFTDDEVAC